MTLIGQLSRLESAGLIRLAQFEPDLEYLFRHSLVQDAAYDSLLTSDRKRLHRAVGEAVEVLYADRIDEYSAMLARHFQQAGSDEQALKYFTRAAAAALATYANQEAESLYRNALALACSEAQRAVLLAGLGEALYGSSRFGEAIQTWREAIGLSQALGDMERVARLYARSARAAWYSGDTPGGLRLSEEGLAAVAGAAESPDLARLIHETGRAYHFNGRPDKASALCRQALEMAERLGAVAVQVDALTTLGILPDTPAEESLAALTRAVELAESAGLLEPAVRAHHDLGAMIQNFHGDLRAGRDHFLRAAELAHRRGGASEEVFSWISAIGSSFSLGELAVVEAALPEIETLVSSVAVRDVAWLELQIVRAGLAFVKGEWAESLRLWRLSQREARQRGDLQVIRQTGLELAQLILELDRLGELGDEASRATALAEAETGLVEAIEIDKRGLGDQVWAPSQLAILRARQGRVQEARDLIVQAREAASARPTIWDEDTLRLAEAHVAEAEGQWTDVLALTEAIANFRARLGHRWIWARTLVEWAGAHVQRGQPADLERAQALLREARAAFQEMGASGYVDVVNKRLDAVRGEVYTRTLALDKAARELAVAGRIQAGLLPERVPEVPGWQVTATLDPAHETSGDFYDFVPLPDGRLGLVIADVSDKGAGAAVYMALARTLLRTYAAQFPAQPRLALATANQRIVQETRTGMFVTVFYGVLELETGTLTYCNAGHHPAYLLTAVGVEPLGGTGLPLGIVEDAAWEQGSVHLATGDALVLYTDGVTDAQKADGDPFGRERLREVVQDCRGGDAGEVEAAVLGAIHHFVGDAPRFDDLTLVVVARK